MSEVFPAAELDAAVDALCAQIMKAPRPARVGCKDYARAALDMDVDRRDRIRPQHPRGDQLIERDAAARPGIGSRI